MNMLLILNQKQPWRINDFNVRDNQEWDNELDGKREGGYNFVTGNKE